MIVGLVRRWERDPAGGRAAGVEVDLVGVDRTEPREAVRQVPRERAPGVILGVPGVRRADDRQEGVHAAHGPLVGQGDVTDEPRRISS
ncbi:hypothetical protein [Streptomyces sp. NBC_01750]|uniref:hypothetical protein n=1 Tax=Streptomyces sp. NBC_01750 TaxID=2975928 RepID=UPI002DD8C920|nr:hypothetical protein [Streptomyces sp. NBC_01750]WSD32643.1 hypothetical protein OG966_12360 [Streptomyces sp. NBC_01750]